MEDANTTNLKEKDLTRSSLLNIFIPRNMSINDLSEFYYTYDYDNGTGELYMRVGTALFSICAMMDRCLSLVQMFEAYVNNHEAILKCKITFLVTLSAKTLSLLFIFLQSFFIFKYANIIINYGKNTAMLGLMHLICTNFCVFLRSIVHETVTEIRHYNSKSNMEHHGLENKSFNSKLNNYTFESLKHITKVHHTTRGKLVGCIDTMAFTSEIAAGIKEARDKLSPYLFPCIIEYSLICLTVFYVLLKSIQNRYKANNDLKEIQIEQQHNPNLSPTSNDQLRGEENEIDKHKNHLYIKNPNRSSRSLSMYVDCENSNKQMKGSRLYSKRKSSSIDMLRLNRLKSSSSIFQAKRYAHQFTIDCGKSTTGLFFGIAVVLITITSFIVYFIYRERDSIFAMTLSDTTELFLIVLSLLVSIIIYAKLKYHKFEYKKYFEFGTDIFLVITGLAGIYIFGIYTIIAILSKGVKSYFDTLSLTLQIVTILESTFQTVLIIESQNMLTKDSYTKKSKPSRSLITLLILVDVSLWLSETFTVKKFDMYDIQIGYYDIVFWSLVSAISCPLAIFFRFHSSFCLSNIWKTLYE